MAELDPNIPLNYLSGATTKNYFANNPLSSMMETYLTSRKNQQLFDEIERKKEAYKNVAAVRKNAANAYMTNFNASAKDAESKSLDDKIAAKEAELAEIDAKIAELEASVQSSLSNQPSYNLAVADNTNIGKQNGNYR